MMIMRKRRRGRRESDNEEVEGREKGIEGGGGQRVEGEGEE